MRPVLGRSAVCAWRSAAIARRRHARSLCGAVGLLSTRDVGQRARSDSPRRSSRSIQHEAHFGEPHAAGADAKDAKDAKDFKQDDGVPAATSADSALNKLLASGSTDEILNLVDRRGHDFNEVHFSTAVNRLAKSLEPQTGNRNDQRLEALAQLAAASIGEGVEGYAKRWPPQRLSWLCWGLAKIGGVDGTRLVLEAAAEEAITKLDSFQPMHLANLVSAFATAGVEAPLLFEAVSAEFPRKMHGAKPSDFSMTLWAAATVRVDAPMLFDAAAKHLVTNPEVVAACIECELADLLWAYARAGVRAPQLFHILTTEALRRDLSAFPAACLAQMAWAVCTSSHDAPDLLDGVSAAAVPKLAKWIDAELSLLYQVYVVRRLEAGNSRFVEDLRGHEEVMRSAHHRSGKAGDLTFSVIADMTDLTLSVMADMTDADMQSWLKQTPTL